MAIESRIVLSSQPIGIPGQQARPSQESYGSSPPVRLPAFGTSINSESPHSSSSSHSISLPELIPDRRKRSPKNSSSMRDFELSVNFCHGEQEDLLVPLSTSFFSTISIDDFEIDEESIISNKSSPRGSNVTGDACFNRITRQGRKILRSNRLPIEHILEFEQLVFDHLQSKTPRNRMMADEEHFFVVTIQNPFRRSILHSVCQYYYLSSQTMNKLAGATVIRATSQTTPLPPVRLSQYLIDAFGHAIPEA